MISRFNQALLALALAALITGCADSNSYFVGETNSLRNCLAKLENTIKLHTGQNRPYRFWEISTDKPDRVNGWVWHQREGFFSCELKRTGTRGAYWRASVAIPDNRLRTNAR